MICSNMEALGERLAQDVIGQREGTRGDLRLQFRDQGLAVRLEPLCRRIGIHDGPRVAAVVVPAERVGQNRNPQFGFGSHDSSDVMRPQLVSPVAIITKSLAASGLILFI